MPGRLPKLRGDLRVARQEADAQIYYVVSDPISGKYIRLREPEYRVLSSLDGETDASEISRQIENEFTIQVPPEAIERFVERFDNLAFLETKRSEYVLSQEENRARTRKTSVFFIRFNAFNPERLLDSLLSRLRFMFRPAFLAMTAMTIMIGVYLLVDRISMIPLNLIQIFGFSTVVVAMISLGIVIVMHEFAHALVCHYYGGRVREMGFLLIYFQPALYCNLSDSYMFPRKHQKINTLAAGMYFQIFLGSLSLILWRILKEGTFVSEILLVTAVVSFGTLIFNINPLLKLDGYYLLTDVFDIPNLRSKAFLYFKQSMVHIAFGIKPTGVSHTPREKRIFLFYSILSIIYTAVLLGIVGSYAFELLVGRWRGTGFLLFAGLVLTTFKPLLMSTAKEITKAAKEGGVTRVRKSRWILWGVILILVAVLLFVLRVDLKVTSRASLRAIESFHIYQPEESVIRSRYFSGGANKKYSERIYQLASLDFSVFRLDPVTFDGSTLLSGDTLLSVSSNLYEAELRQVQSDLSKSQAQFELLLSDPKAEEIASARAEVDRANVKLREAKNDWERTRKLFNGGMVSEEVWEEARTVRSVAEKELEIAESKYDLLRSGPKAEELEIVDAEMRKLDAKIKYLEEQIDASNFLAPFDGKVVRSNKSNELLTLIRTDTLEVVVQAPEEDIDILKPNQPMVLRVAGYPAISFGGKVAAIHELVTSDGKMSYFAATCIVANRDGMLKPGMTGYAKIYCGRTNLASIAVRKILRFFRVEFWSWW